MSMPIIGKGPKDWQDLQQFVSNVLADCGFHTTIEKPVATVRGIVEIDVYAEKATAYNTKILCECKCWNSAIPQTIIHAFRTVVEDTGASQGIIISKLGFQKGAYDAILNTNISIFSWEQFQEAFTIDYLHFIVERNYKKGHELRNKENTLISMHHASPALSNDEFNEFQLLRERYSDFIFYSFKEHYEHLDTKEINITEAERGINSASKDLGISPKSLKEYFDYIYNKCQEMISKLDSIASLWDMKKR